jgi:hypothetical protein
VLHKAPLGQFFAVFTMWRSILLLQLPLFGHPIHYLAILIAKLTVDPA